jgi:hypothetical protein
VRDEDLVALASRYLAQDATFRMFADAAAGVITTQVTLEYASPTSGSRLTTLKFDPVLESGRRMSSQNRRIPHRSAKSPSR